MTDNEIIKALECCIKDNCDCGECPAISVCQQDCDCPKTIALDLITHQKAEIERLKTLNSKLEAEVVALKTRYTMDRIATNNAKAKAIKEFAERLKMNITINNTNDGCLDYSVDYGCLMEDIDDLVKEMVGDV